MKKIGIFNVFFLTDKGNFFLLIISTPIHSNSHQVTPDKTPLFNKINFNSENTN